VSKIAMTARDRRLLVGGAIVVLGILGTGRGVPALLAHTKERQRAAAELTARATRSAWLARNAGTLARALTRSDEELARHRAAFVAGSTAGAASANLAELVTDAVGATDARLSSIRASADSDTAPSEVGRVVVHASVTGDLLSLATVLQTLEEGPHVLVVSELSVAATQPTVAQDQPEQLQAELVVDGLYRASPKEHAP
jgi:hypothetical protein